MEISFTQYRVYRECPWKFKLLFVDRKRIPLTPSASLGLSLHKALECFHRAEGADLEKLLDCYDQRWVGGGYASSSERDQYYEKGLRILEKYHALEERRRSQVVGIEREFFYPLGEHMVRGMIDRVDLLPDGRHEVIDYKTRLDPDAEGKESALLQLRFYALGVKECLGITPALLTVHYLAADRRDSVPYDESGEEALKADILAAADSIEAGSYGPDTAFCPRCDFRRACAHSVART